MFLYVYVMNIEYQELFDNNISWQTRLVHLIYLLYLP